MRAGQEEACQEVLAAVQVRFEVGLDEHCSSADVEWRWSDSGYILEVKLTGLADGQDCGK